MKRLRRVAWLVMVIADCGIARLLAAASGASCQM